MTIETSFLRLRRVATFLDFLVYSVWVVTNIANIRGLTESSIAYLKLFLIWYKPANRTEKQEK